MNICVYGASSDDIDQNYITATQTLGRQLGQRGHTLLFGGGAHGLMGAAARGVKAAGGTVVGVAPSFFQVDGVLFDRCDRFYPTETMRQRKQLLEDEADAFVAAPGGIGTFDELFEILTLKQLGRHNKPVALYNLQGYFDPVLALLKQMTEQGFMKAACLELLASFDRPEPLLAYLEGYDQAALDVRHLKNI